MSKLFAPSRKYVPALTSFHDYEVWFFRYADPRYAVFSWSQHSLFKAKDLKDAVRLAKNMAKPGDAIVLSPACASFDEFKNFEHRGKFFQELAFSL
ncbi:hypothetical protein Pfo_028211 [Paulownia fortunei]|nr:hypothetical protein Pfo_028211 [Paulownia fortunei]